MAQAGNSRHQNPSVLVAGQEGANDSVLRVEYFNLMHGPSIRLTPFALQRFAWFPRLILRSNWDLIKIIRVVKRRRCSELFCPYVTCKTAAILRVTPGGTD